jgi:hypothetical protein
MPPPRSVLANRVIRFRQHTLALLEPPHKETGKNFFNGLLYRAHRWAQCALGGDLHCAQGSMIRRSSLDAGLRCVALTAVLALCRNHWIETFAARMARVCGRSSFCALLHCMEIFVLRRAPACAPRPQFWVRFAISRIAGRLLLAGVLLPF